MHDIVCALSPPRSPSLHGPLCLSLSPSHTHLIPLSLAPNSSHLHTLSHIRPRDITWHEDNWGNPDSRYLAWTLHDTDDTGVCVWGGACVMCDMCL